MFRQIASIHSRKLTLFPLIFSPAVIFFSRIPKPKKQWDFPLGQLVQEREKWTHCQVRSLHSSMSRERSSWQMRLTTISRGLRLQWAERRVTMLYFTVNINHSPLGALLRCVPSRWSQEINPGVKRKWEMLLNSVQMRLFFHRVLCAEFETPFGGVGSWKNN